MSKESKRLSSKSRQIERDIDNLVERVVQSKISRVTSTYETRIAELEQEQALIEEEIAKIATPDHSFEEMFELSMRFLANPYEIWKKGDLEVKKTVLRLVFARPLTVSRKTGVQTGETTFPFKALHFLKGTKFEMVRSRRLELPRVLPHSDLNAARLPIPPRPH